MGSEDLRVPLLPLQDTEPDPGGHLTPPAQKSPHAEGRAFNGWLQNLRDGRVVPTRAVMPNQEAGPCPWTLWAVPGRHGCWEMVFGADSSLGGGRVGWHAHLPPPTRKTWSTLTRVVNNHQHLQTMPMALIGGKTTLVAFYGEWLTLLTRPTLLICAYDRHSRF